MSSIPLLGWAGLVAVGLLVPGDVLPIDRNGIDSEIVAVAAHLVFFFGLGGLALLRFGWRHRWFVLGGSFVYGAALELLQALVPGRSIHADDLLVNAVGAGFALLVAVAKGSD